MHVLVDGGSSSSYYLCYYQVQGNKKFVALTTHRCAHLFPPKVRPHRTPHPTVNRLAAAVEHPITMLTGRATATTAPTTGCAPAEWCGWPVALAMVLRRMIGSSTGDGGDPSHSLASAERWRWRLKPRPCEGQAPATMVRCAGSGDGGTR